MVGLIANGSLVGWIRLWWFNPHVLGSIPTGGTPAFQKKKKVGLISSINRQMEQKGNYVGMGTDWEQALHRYETVIACEGEDLQIRATFKLAKLSKDVPHSILARTVPTLVELLGCPWSESTPSVQEAAAYCLSHIARQGDGELAMIIGQSGVVPSLLRLLQQSEGRFRSLLIKFLWILVNFSNLSSLNRIILARNSGLEIVVNLIHSSVDGTRQHLLEILSALALLREVRRVIIGFGGLPLLVESARCGSMISRARAVQAIGLLGQTRTVRRMLVELDVIPLLIELLRDGDNSMKLIAANSLGIMASHVDYIRPVARAGAIPLCAELLKGPEPLGREIAEDVLSILAVVEANAVSVAQHLVRILQGDNDEGKAAAANVVWNLSGYKHSIHVIQESGAIPLLVELLRNGNCDVREKVSGAVAQLSYDEVGRRALADTEVVPLLISLLHGESEELKDYAAETLINFSEDPLLRDSVSEAFNIPSFQTIQNRLVRVHASDDHMARSLRQMTVEQFTWNSDLS